MFGLIKRSAHEAVVDRLMGDVAVAQAEVNRMAAELSKARADRDVSEGLHQEERKARRIAEVRHAAALQTVTDERDALRAEVEALKPEVERARARRAKATANLKNQRRAGGDAVQAEAA